MNEKSDSMSLQIHTFNYRNWVLSDVHILPIFGAKVAQNQVKQCQKGSKISTVPWKKASNRVKLGNVTKIAEKPLNFAIFEAQFIQYSNLKNTSEVSPKHIKNSLNHPKILDKLSLVQFRLQALKTIHSLPFFVFRLGCNFSMYEVSYCLFKIIFKDVNYIENM